MHAPTPHAFQRPAPNLSLLTLAEVSDRWNRRISPFRIQRSQSPLCREGILAGDRVLRLPHARVGGRCVTTVEWLAAFLADLGDFDAATLAARTRRSPLRSRPLTTSRPGRRDSRRALAVAACEEAGL